MIKVFFANGSQEFTSTHEAFLFAHQVNGTVKRDGVTLCPPASEMDQKRATKRAKTASRLPGISLGVRLDHDIVAEKCDNLVKARSVLANKRAHSSV